MIESYTLVDKIIMSIPGTSLRWKRVRKGIFFLQYVKGKSFDKTFDEFKKFSKDCYNLDDNNIIKFDTVYDFIFGFIYYYAIVDVNFSLRGIPDKNVADIKHQRSLYMDHCLSILDLSLKKAYNTYYSDFIDFIIVSTDTRYKEYGVWTPHKWLPSSIATPIPIKHHDKYPNPYSKKNNKFNFMGRKIR